MKSDSLIKSLKQQQKDGAKSHAVRNVNGKKYNATKSKIRRLIRLHFSQNPNRNAVVCTQKY